MNSNLLTFPLAICLGKSYNFQKRTVTADGLRAVYGNGAYFIGYIYCTDYERRRLIDMLRIAICDDEKPFLKIMEYHLKLYLSKYNIVYKIDAYRSGKKLIELGSDIIRYSIIFLDINMNGGDGIQTAEMIRKHSDDIFIVFVTAFIDYSLEGYKVGALRYLLKTSDNFEASISECMDVIIEKMDYNTSYKNFHFRECPKSIAIDRIMYIESSLHRLEFHIMEGHVKIYTMYGTLNNIEQELDSDDFLRIHQSYLINMKYIKSIRNKIVILENGKEFIIPKARYRDVKTRFIVYKGEI